MKYKTCVSIAQKTPRGLNKVVKKALKKSDYVEIRFDFLKPAEVPKALELLKNYLKKSVCTLRPKSEGGKFSGVEKERIAILKLIAEYNPFLLDVEFNSLKKNKTLVKYLKKTKTPILVSWHDFKKTPNIATLNSTSNKNGLYSAINLRIAILSFSTPENFPPSDFGLNVQTDFFKSFLSNSKAFGTSAGFRKSNLIST